MIRLTRFELSKIWKNQVFLFSFITLLFVNLFLLWGQAQNEKISPAAYKQFISHTQSMSMEELNQYIMDKYTEIKAIVTIDGIQREMAYGTLTADAVQNTYGDLMDKYYPLHQSGEYLDYTEDVTAEYSFINSISHEFSQVAEYTDFRKGIDEKADQIRTVSIFASEDSYISRNLLKTQQDYANMGDVEIFYTPQKGLRYAINFYLSDLIAMLAIVFLAFTSLRYERDKGLLKLIRSTTEGHVKTALARACEGISVNSLSMIIFKWVVRRNTTYHPCPHYSKKWMFYQGRPKAVHLPLIGQPVFANPADLRT